MTPRTSTPNKQGAQTDNKPARIIVDVAGETRIFDATHWFISEDDLICIYDTVRETGIDYRSHVSNVALIDTSSDVLAFCSDDDELEIEFEGDYGGEESW